MGCPRSHADAGGSHLELPFDAYQRYRLVADLVRRFPGYGAGTSVLDVGGRTGLMQGFLDEARVDAVDVEASDLRGLVVGSGGALPFRDGTFDVVTACDTLEHVPAPLRERFLAECARVSRGWVVLAGPYDAPEVRESEAQLRDFLKHKLALDHRYLNEHAEHGLPSQAETEAAFVAAGCTVTSVGHASLARWVPLLCLEMYLDSDAPLREVAKRYYRVYNEALYATDHAGPVYRHAVIAAQDGVALPSTEGLFTRPVAPPEVHEMFGELFAELVAFDRERDVYEAERERMRVVNEGLHADLLGHAETLATVRADLTSHQESLQTVRADLDEHRATLCERTKEYEAEHALRETLEGELEVQRRTIAELQQRARTLQDVNGDLESDLNGHRETLAAVRLELDGFRSEHEAVLNTVRADLDAHRDVLSSHERELDARARLIGELRGDRERLEGELTEARHARDEQDEVRASLEREVARLREELELEHETNDVLRQDLADRWKSFRRAIEPRRHA